MKRIVIASTTGTHVHVSKCDMTPWHTTKLAAFIYDPDNRDFLERFGGRSFGEYRIEVDYIEYAPAGR